MQPLGLALQTIDADVAAPSFTGAVVAQPGLAGEFEALLAQAARDAGLSGEALAQALPDLHKGVEKLTGADGADAEAVIAALLASLGAASRGIEARPRVADANGIDSGEVESVEGSRLVGCEGEPRSIKGPASLPSLVAALPANASDGEVLGALSLVAGGERAVAPGDADEVQSLQASPQIASVAPDASAVATSESGAMAADSDVANTESAPVAPGHIALHADSFVAQAHPPAPLEPSPDQPHVDAPESAALPRGVGKRRLDDAHTIPDRADETGDDGARAADAAAVSTQPPALHPAAAALEAPAPQPHEPAPSTNEGPGANEAVRLNARAAASPSISPPARNAPEQEGGSDDAPSARGAFRAMPAEDREAASGDATQQDAAQKAAGPVEALAQAVRDEAKGGRARPAFAAMSPAGLTTSRQPVSTDAEAPESADLQASPVVIEVLRRSEGAERRDASLNGDASAARPASDDREAASLATQRARIEATADHAAPGANAAATPASPERQASPDVALAPAAPRIAPLPIETAAAQASRETYSLAAEIRMRALERQVVAAVRAGADEVRMQLYPPGLGQVVIMLNMDGQRLRLSLKAAGGHATDALQKMEGGLREGLSGAGFELAEFGVSDSTSDEQGERRGKRDDAAPQPQRTTADTFTVDMNA